MVSKLAFTSLSPDILQSNMDSPQAFASRDREFPSAHPFAADWQTHNAETVLQRALENISELMRLPTGQVWIVDHDRLCLKAHVGCSLGNCAVAGLRVGECYCGTCAQSGQIIALPDLYVDDRTMALPCAQAGFRSIILVPLKTNTKTLGTLLFADPHSNAFGALDERMLTGYGSCLAMVLETAQLHCENARRHQKNQVRYEALVALLETSLGLIAQLDTTELIEAMLRRATLLLGAKSCSLFLYDRQTHLIHNIATYNNWRDWTGVTLQPGEGVIGQVIQTGNPMIINDYANWEHRHNLNAHIPSTRKMGAPLRWQNQVIGGVVVANEFKSRPFDDDDLWLFTQFADLVSLAVKNAVLYTQVKQFSQELENQVTIRTLELSRAKDEVAARSEQLRLLLAKTIRVQEDERARIARDMHDGALQLINAARYQIQSAEIGDRQELSPRVQDKLLATRELLDEMEQEIRHAISNLRPLILDTVGLVPALENHAQKLEQISGIIGRFKIVGNPVKLPTELENSVYHLVQQAISNVMTHSHATETWISMDYQTSILCITVDDNGNGFDEQRWQQEAGRNGKHLGLLGMLERVKSLGGSMHIEPVPSGGTHLSFWLPIQREPYERADSSIDC